MKCPWVDFNGYKYSVRNIKSINKYNRSLHTSTLSGTSHYGDTIDTKVQKGKLDASIGSAWSPRQKAIWSVKALLVWTRPNISLRVNDSSRCVLKLHEKKSRVAFRFAVLCLFFKKYKLLL